MTDGHDQLVRLVRDSRREVVAGLVRVLGDVDLAEDAVQDAVVRALETWPVRGVPDNPVAWLRLTARRRAVDVVRREAVRPAKERLASGSEVAVGDDRGHLRRPDDVVLALSESCLPDDVLRLVFTCCHPTLSPEAQVALSLRTLLGLSTTEVARLLLVTPETLTRRLTRAKQKIRQARVPFRVPADHELPQRWAAVCATVYLVFTEGWSPGAGDLAVRDELADEGVRLARLLHDLAPDDPSSTGLLALLLLQHSRRAARTDDHGDLVLLADQDRTRWRHDLVHEGVVLLGRALARTPEHPDRYVVQAAIAACHALAPSAEATDWAAVTSWYEVLLTLDDGPVVRLNHAAALAHRDGPAVGLDAVDALAATPGLPATGVFHATRAELLRRLGRSEEALAAAGRARELGLNGAQRRHLDRSPAVRPRTSPAR